MGRSWWPVCEKYEIWLLREKLKMKMASSIAAEKTDEN